MSYSNLFMKCAKVFFVMLLSFSLKAQSIYDYDRFEISRTYHERTTISYLYEKVVDENGNWTISVKHDKVGVLVKKLVIQNYTKDIINHFNISSDLFNQSKAYADEILKMYKDGEYKILYTTDNKPIMPEIGDRLVYLIILSKKSEFKAHLIKVNNINNTVEKPVVFNTIMDLKPYWDKTLNLADGITFF